MIRFYFHPSPNPMKVALFLEEAGLPYELVPVDTLKGEQHRPEFLALNPNAKTPVITDGDDTVFDSNAILLYLADKHGRFGGRPEQRAELLSWLMFVATGVGPYSGQAVHFQRFAPEKLPYAVNRYVKEAQRHFGILDRRLADGRPHLLGDDYTIVDMAAWGWTNALPFVLGEGALAAYPVLRRWHEAVSARPAASRAHALKEKLTLKKEFDEEARRAMFPQNVAA